MNFKIYIYEEGMEMRLVKPVTCLTKTVLLILTIGPRSRYCLQDQSDENNFLVI